MNVILINDFAYVDGGASKVALRSARALAERGHRVLLFTAVGPVSPSMQNVEGLEVVCLGQSDVAQHPRPMDAAIQGIWNEHAAKCFAQVLTRFPSSETVVHIHTWTKALSASVLRVAVRRRFATVLTLHDYFSACPNGGFFIYPTQQLCHLRPMSAACLSTQCDSRSYGHKLWRVARQLSQNNIGGIPDEVDTFISISEMSEVILRPYLPAGSRICRVPNPIDQSPDPPADPALSERFTYVGRLSQEKGTALLARCAERGNFRVTFVGEGAERQKLSQLARNAEFTGWLAGPDVASVVRTSRALVFPSLWYETQGMSVAEAAAVGVPAIVSSQTAAREWIEDGSTGLLFDHGNEVDLQRKMDLLRQDPALAQEMGRQAYQRYWRNPATTELHCDALERVYATTLAGRVSSTRAILGKKAVEV